MNRWRKLRLRFAALFQRRKLDAEMDEEMRSHIEMQTQENIGMGMNPEEARYAVLRQFEWVESIKETCCERRVSVQQARVLLETVAKRRAQDHPEANRKWTIEAKPARTLFVGPTLERTLWSLGFGFWNFCRS